ncbi:MAG: hypothetical protein OHM56_00485 [Spiroplasma phoeniceum]|nr:MAG: hypothetical protein OHM57_13000 [Spiroplasma phoeniceum]UZQ32500.1 MAG: hypothetical protein OHM56_00485 [Spiroplasma phoeniceum]
MIQAYSPIANTIENQIIVAEAKKCNCTVTKLFLAWIQYFSIQTIAKAELLRHIQENKQSEKIRITKKTIQILQSLNIYDNIYPETFNRL